MHARRLFLLVILCSCLLGADWSRFRGPNGTGAVADKDIPVNWSKDNILWKKPLTGAGHSSPIIVGKKLLVQSATRTERQVHCFDAVSGKQLWAKKVAGKVGKTHSKSSLA